MALRRFTDLVSGSSQQPTSEPSFDPFAVQNFGAQSNLVQAQGNLMQMDRSSLALNQQQVQEVQIVQQTDAQGNLVLSAARSAMNIPIPDTPEKANLRAENKGLQQALQYTYDSAIEEVMIAKRRACQKEEQTYHHMEDRFRQACSAYQDQVNKEQAIKDRETQDVTQSLKSELVSEHTEARVKTSFLYEALRTTEQDEVHAQMLHAQAQDEIQAMQDSQQAILAQGNLQLADA